MTSIVQVMSHDHKRCDDYFAEAENQVANKNWNEAKNALMSFIKAMQHHFSHEENVLFPAFENTTGSTGGPTMMMRLEHQQMRDLMEDMEAALKDNNRDRYLGLSETLLIFMQQHNMKEEQILYPMIENTCSDQSDELLKDFSSNINSDAA